MNTKVEIYLAIVGYIGVSKLNVGTLKIIDGIIDARLHCMGEAFTRSCINCYDSTRWLVRGEF